MSKEDNSGIEMRQQLVGTSQGINDEANNQ